MSDGDGEDVYISGMDSELKEVLDARPGTLAENVNTLLWRAIGGKTKAELERKLEHAKRRQSEFEADISELQQSKSEEEDRIKALKSKIGDVNADPMESDVFDSHYMEKVEQMERDGMHYHEDMPVVEEMASELGVEPVELVGRVMQRVVSEDRAIHATQFYLPEHTRDDDNGLQETHSDYEVFEAKHAEYREAPRADEITVDDMGDFEAWSK